MKSNKTLVLSILIVLAATLVSISTFAFVYAATSTAATASGTNGWSRMMSSMMDGSWSQSSTVQTPTTQNTILPLIGFVALVGAALTRSGGAVYYFKVPKIRATTLMAESTVNNLSQNAVTPYESVSKTLTTEERKVLDVLISHNGKYLQKYIRAETGLSRLKTHRIVTRLAERGVVTLERSGNTNEVYLSSWLQNKPYSNVIINKQAENQELTVEA